VTLSRQDIRDALRQGSDVGRAKSAALPIQHHVETQWTLAQAKKPAEKQARASNAAQRRWFREKSTVPGGAQARP
jgi:hypothetical protein